LPNVARSFSALFSRETNEKLDAKAKKEETKLTKTGADSSKKDQQKQKAVSFVLVFAEY
jgi:hypothetical protein